MKLSVRSENTNQTINGVLLTGLGLILVLIFICFFSIYQARVKQIQLWEKQLENISLTLSLQTSQSLDTAKIVLDTVMDNIQQLDIKNEAEFRDKLATQNVFNMLNDRKMGISHIDVVSIVANNGDNINFTRSFPVKGINLSERDYFQAHLKDPNLGIFLGVPVRNKGNGKETFYITKSIRNHQGNFLGMVIVGMSVDYLTDFYEIIANNLGKNITVNLQRDDFTVFARYPKLDNMIGKVNVNSSIYEVVNNQKKSNGIVTLNTTRMSTDTVEARMAYVRKVEKYQFYTSIIVPLEEVLAPWYHATKLILAIGLSALVVILIGMRYLIRSLKIRESGFQEMRDLSSNLDSANKAKAKFIATMSHEIRTPLNGILGMSQLLLDKKISIEDKSGYIKTIIDSGKVLQVLLNDILDFSKIEAGKIEFANLAINLSQLLEETITLYSQLALNKNIQLHYELQGPEGQLYLTDPIRLKQILSNLTMNAIKFTDEGEVKIIAKEVSRNGASAHLEFQIIDTGVGIKKDDIPSLFKAFSQLKPASGPHQTGTGLGLSIVGSIIDAMKGSYGVESDEGKGSTFWVMIPVEILDTDSLAEGAQTSISDSNQLNDQYFGKVLIAEDNSTNQLVLSEMIKSLSVDIQLVIAGNGRICVDQYLEHPDVDLILMDIGMPVMDGYEAATEIRRIESTHHSKKIPIVAVTAYVNESDRKKFLSHGMEDFIPKPIELSQLEQVFKAYLSKNTLSKAEQSTVQAEEENPQIFNYPKMLKRLGGNIPLSKKILQSAIGEAPKFIDHLFESIQEGNLLEQKNIVHTMKGLSGQIGGDQLEIMLMNFDDRIRNGGSINNTDVEFIDQSFNQLINEIYQQGVINT